jgi:hypothetical protein
MVFVPRLEMERRCAGSAIGTVVFAGEAVDAVLPEVAFLGGFDDRGLESLADDMPIEFARVVDLKKDAARVLAKRLAFDFGQADVLFDDPEGVIATRVLYFLGATGLNGVDDILGQLGRSLANDLETSLVKLFLKRGVHIPQH